MPIYEYQCPKCHKVFEEFSKIIAEGHIQEPCPDCGAISPRLISHTSFVLKGGGWYVTDYGYRKGIKDDGSTDSEAAADAGPETAAADGDKTGFDAAAKAPAKKPAKPGAKAKTTKKAAKPAKKT